MSERPRIEPPNADEWPTCIKLAIALEYAGAPSFMVLAARHGAYHDYLSSSPAPELDLMNQARQHGLQIIIDGILEGRWDATKEESDRWAASQDGQETLGRLAPRAPKLARNLGYQPPRPVSPQPKRHGGGHHHKHHRRN